MEQHFDLRQERADDLRRFVASIAARPLKSVGTDVNLLSAGVIESLDVIRVVLYLEQRYNIDFSSYRGDPAQLTCIDGILDFIEANEGVS